MRVSIFPRCDVQMYFDEENLMDVSFLQETAERCRSLAEKADEFTKRRLLELANKYEHRIAKSSPAKSSPTKSSPATRFIRTPAGLTDAPGRAYAPDRHGTDASPL
jgi:hypothetical protein